MIAILGATSQIAKNLIVRFDHSSELKLFCRNESAMEDFLNREKPSATWKISSYDSFHNGNYSAIINCVGIADPKKQKSNPYESFTVTEYYDNMCIDYTRSHAATRYINFSSGAVFGTEFTEPVNENSVAAFVPNNIISADYYRLSKLNAEAKHRCLAELPIVDIRVFSFFSRFIDLNAGFLLSEIANCLLNNIPFSTNTSDIVRDFISPDDLFILVSAILSRDKQNIAIDACSKKQVRKMEIIDALSRQFGLKVKMIESDLHTVSGKKSEYYSVCGLANKKFDFVPSYSSLQCIQNEMTALLDKQREVSTNCK